jgi:uncharacterized protein (TIGR00369 family)
MAERPVERDPEGGCFGCGPHNAHGLRLVFRERGDGRVECLYTAPAHLAGAPGVIHGGIQATLLDEAMGHAIHAGERDESLDVVTVDLRLRYRRPAPTGTALAVSGRLVRVDGRDYHVEGEIRSAAGELLTAAEGRWRRIG